MSPFVPDYFALVPKSLSLTEKLRKRHGKEGQCNSLHSSINGLEVYQNYRFSRSCYRLNVPLLESEAVQEQGPNSGQMYLSYLQVA